MRLRLRIDEAKAQVEEIQTNKKKLLKKVSLDVYLENKKEAGTQSQL